MKPCQYSRTTHWRLRSIVVPATCLLAGYILGSWAQTHHHHPHTPPVGNYQHDPDLMHPIIQRLNGIIWVKYHGMITIEPGSITFIDTPCGPQLTSFTLIATQWAWLTSRRARHITKWINKYLDHNTWESYYQPVASTLTLTIASHKH